MMRYSLGYRKAAALTVCTLAVLATGTTSLLAPVPSAQAVPTWNEYQQKLDDQAKLKDQLAGVDKELADVILKLNDLTEHKIPAAQSATQKAQQAADQAKSVAQATEERLQAAQKDKTDLQTQIEQTGLAYDDAQESVAQIARSSFHGSSASDIMGVITGSSDTQEFVDRMQAQAAVARSEANVAHESAVALSTSMNRKDRLDAIEQQISNLKTQADRDAQAAQRAAQEANQQESQLQKLREEGDAARKKLESNKNKLTTQAAQEAAAIVQMKSEIDAYNESLQKRGGSADVNTGGQQQTAPAVSAPAPAPAPAPAAPAQPAPAASAPNGMDYNPFGNCYEGMAYCYGHPTGNTVGGNAYPWSQCTWYAYHRRVDYYHLPTGSYMGNGGDWANTGRKLGYLVNRTPHQGAAIVFAPGQAGSDPYYGHVAVVERVNADGSILISECGWVFQGVAHWRTIYDPWNYWYVHY